MEDSPVLPIGRDPEPIMSRHMLMIAHEERIVASYRFPFDTRNEINVPLVIDELTAAGYTFIRPPEPGWYYFLWIFDDTGGRVPVILPEGEVKPFVLALAVKSGDGAADRLIYRSWMLPAKTT